MILKRTDKELQNSSNIIALSNEQIKNAVEFLLDEKATVNEKVNFLQALNDKGILPEEIALFVKYFLKYSLKVKLSKNFLKKPTIDLCGTGGDKLNLFNVSTTSSFIVCAGECGVTKHGNRGITSKSGGADVLEELGVKIDMDEIQLSECLDSIGMGFIFAQKYHPAFKSVAPARMALAKEGKTSIFNIIGPLLNPLNPDYQLLGVYNKDLLNDFAKILSNLGRKAAWIVHGYTEDNKPIDEISNLNITEISELNNKNITNRQISPKDFNLPKATLSDLMGGDAQENALILKNILNGKDKGPKRDITVLNAAAAFVICGKASKLQDGIKLSNDLIDSGQAYDKLQKLINFSSK